MVAYQGTLNRKEFEDMIMFVVSKMTIYLIYWKGILVL